MPVTARPRQGERRVITDGAFRNRVPNSYDSGKRGEARAPFGAECGKTSNLQLYRVSTLGRDGPGKKSRTNSHRLAEWPQLRCNTSWCIDLCGPMQRARVFSSLLYQDVMVLDVPEKDPAQPCKKTLVPQSPLNSTLRSPPRRLRSFARATARVTKLWAPAAAPAAAPAFGKLVHAGGCGGGGGAFAQRVRPGRCRLTARVFAPQVRTMAAGAEGDRQVWACITTLRAGVRTEL